MAVGERSLRRTIAPIPLRYDAVIPEVVGPRSAAPESVAIPIRLWGAGTSWVELECVQRCPPRSKESSLSAHPCARDAMWWPSEEGDESLDIGAIDSWQTYWIDQWVAASRD